MADIFISYIEEDGQLAGEIAVAVEREGYTAWYFERDSEPFAPYPVTVGRAIDNSQAAILILTPLSIRSARVVSEVVRAFEREKKLAPVLRGITHKQLEKAEPTIGLCIGAAVSVNITKMEQSEAVSKVANGLKQLGIVPGHPRRPAAEAELDGPEGPFGIGSPGDGPNSGPPAIHRVKPAPEGSALGDQLQRMRRWLTEVGEDGRLPGLLGAFAVFFHRHGEDAKALSLLKEEEAQCRKVGDAGGLQRSLGGQARVLYFQGKMGEAFALLRQQEDICRETHDMSGLESSLIDQARVQYHRDHFEEAQTLLNEQEDICRKHGIESGVARCYGLRALILRNSNDPGGAMIYLQKQERLCREIGYKAGLAYALGYQGIITREQGKLKEALEIHQQQLALCNEIGYGQGLQGAYGALALVYEAGGDGGQALDMYRKQEEICRRLNLPEALARCLANQAGLVLWQDPSRTADALALGEEAETIANRLNLALLKRRLEPVLAYVRSRAGQDRPGDSRGHEFSEQQ